MADATADRPLADQIVEAGRSEVTRAEEISGLWAQWAVQLHQLIESMPSAGPDPSYLADDGIEAHLPIHVGIRDRARMEKALIRVLRDADAVSCAWHRAAVDVLAHAHTALRGVEANRRHFQRLAGGEPRG